MLTFFTTAFFCLLSAAFDNLFIICVALFMMGFGIGGNLPIGGSLFVECLPPSRQSLFTLLSIFWPLGQAVTSLIAWALLPSYSCDSPKKCLMRENMGWRYLTFVLGGMAVLMCLARYTVSLQESPKFLIARGRLDEAVAVLEDLAVRNSKEIDISADDFCESETGLADLELRKTNTWARVRPLFETELLSTTILIWIIWAAVTMGSNLFNGVLPLLLESAGKVQLSVSETYRNYVIVSIAAIPGSILGMYFQDAEIFGFNLGRKWTMAIATWITAASVFLFTHFTSNTGQLICSCFAAFFQNIVWGVMFALTPVLFPVYVRATAYGIASSFGNWSGTLAPLLIFYLLQFGYAPPLYLSSAMTALAAICVSFLPPEKKGRDSL